MTAPSPQAEKRCPRRVPRLRRVYAFWVSTLAGFCWAACGQDFHVRNWHLEDGLPDATITAIAQTPEGCLWAGTTRGLVRFDGTQFKIFNPGPVSGLTEAHVAALLVDRSGALWVAGAAGSLARQDNGRFETVSRTRDPNVGRAGWVDSGDKTRWMWGRVSALAQGADNSMWLLFAGSGLLRWRDGEPATFTATNGLPAGEIDDLCSDREGTLWLATGTRLYRLGDGAWVAPPEVGMLGGLLPRLAPAHSGGVWVAAPRGSWITGGGLVRCFSEGKWAAEMEPTPWTPNSLRSQVTAMLEDQAGHLWLGTMWDGVFCSNSEGKWQRVTTEGAFSQSIITCLFEDREGGIWAGTESEGLHRITRRPVKTLTLPSPARENLITAAAVDSAGGVWVGTDGAGAFRFRGEEVTRFASDTGLTNLHVCSILEDRQTRLWAGTWGGLFHFREGRFERAIGIPELDLAVLALFEDHESRLWIGTPRGPICYENGTYVLCPLPVSGQDSDIRCFAEDRAGAIWVGTIGQGLFRLTETATEQFGPAQGLASWNARALFVDSAGTLWVGSEGGGLFRYKDGRFIGYDTRDGLPSNSISSIIDDDDGTLWMGTRNGLFGCSPHQLSAYVRGEDPPVLGRRLGVEEGLSSRGCSGSGQPVAARSADGRLWFPNMRGLALFDPRQVAQGRGARVAFVESLVVDGAEVTPDSRGELRVPSTARRFEFRYTAPDLSTPQSLRFRHLLEGMDQNWVEAGLQRVAHYSQLPPGKYALRVMTGGADGLWHESPKALAFQVVPRWWELRWIQGFAGLFVAGIIAGGIVLNERRRLRRRLDRLEMQQALEGERRRIARDLHDDLGARLTEIFLIGELAKRGEQTPGVLQVQLSGITLKVRQLVTAMEDIVWTINPKNDTLPNLAVYLCDHTERFLTAAQLSCRLDVAEHLPSVAVTAHARHNLLLAVKEVLNNAVRHSGAEQVRLRIYLSEGSVCVTVEDNGRGFDSGHPERIGNGLLNMRSRLEAVGGRVEVSSAPGMGAAVTLILPVSGL